MDAIESGIVKVPRTPVDDDADDDLVTYLRCGTTSASSLPKRAAKDTVKDWLPPKELEGALRSLLPQLREGLRRTGRRSSSQYGETPPVFIVVCPNTVVSASWSTTGSPARQIVEDGEVIAHKPGNLALLQQRRRRPAGCPAAHDPDRLGAARVRRGAEGRLQEGRRRRDREVQGRVPPAQPRRRRRQDHRRGPPPRGDEHRRQEGQARRARPLRGQRLDAHRGLGRQHGHPHPRRPGLRQPAPLRAGRRPRPAPPLATPSTTTGTFEPEYANVYGIPFQFISSDKPIRSTRLRRSRRSRSQRVEGREHLRITFPKLDGYRVELPDEDIWLDLDDAPVFEIGPNTVPDLGRDGRRRRQAASSKRATRPSTGRSRSPSRSPSASSTQHFTHAPATSDRGSSRSS